MFLQGVVNSEVIGATLKKTCLSLTECCRSFKRALLGVIMAALKAVTCRESSNTESHTLIPYTLSCRICVDMSQYKSILLNQLMHNIFIILVFWKNQYDQFPFEMTRSLLC